jgi:hypothetical protein
LTAGALLEELRHRGVKVSTDGDELVLRDPGDMLTDRLLEAVRTAKPALLMLLAAAAPTAEPLDEEHHQLGAYGMGRCQRCRRIMVDRHLRNVDARTWECRDRQDCSNWLRYLQMLKTARAPATGEHGKAA